MGKILKTFNKQQLIKLRKHIEKSVRRQKSGDAYGLGYNLKNHRVSKGGQSHLTAHENSGDF